MPTHDEEAQLLREWAKLTPQQQTLFLAAVDAMVEDLRDHVPFRPSPRMKAVQKTRGVFEVTWALDGRDISLRSLAAIRRGAHRVVPHRRP